MQQPIIVKSPELNADPKQNTTHRISFTALVLALLLLQPKPLLAQSADTPLPLPDLLLYGTATQNGVPITTGNISVILPRGHVVTAEVSPISGTDYSFVLPVPLSMYQDGATLFAADSAQSGESLTFLINNRLALLKQADGATVESYPIPAGSMGRGQLLEILLAGPELYATGDANANGTRDAGDALLAVRHGMALTAASEEFPPADGEVYLPLCDVNADESCDRSDAQHILRCDVGLADIDCAGRDEKEGENNTDTDSGLIRAASIHKSTESVASGAIRLHKIVSRQTDPSGDSSLLTLQFKLDDEAEQFGAASATLAYDSDVVAPLKCDANPTVDLDLGTCNLAYQAERIRFNALTVAGGSDGSTLAEITFQVRDSDVALTDQALAGAFALMETAVYDSSGMSISWFMLESDDSDATSDSTSEDGAKQQSGSQIFLPLVNQNTGETTITATLSERNHIVRGNDNADNTSNSSTNNTSNNRIDLYLPLFVRHEKNRHESLASASQNMITEEKQTSGETDSNRQEGDGHKNRQYRLEMDRRVYLPIFSRQ